MAKKKQSRAGKGDVSTQHADSKGLNANRDAKPRGRGRGRGHQGAGHGELPQEPQGRRLDCGAVRDTA